MQEESKVIKKCLRNNAKAQRALYDLHKVKWFIICLRYAPNKAEAEDMLQEGLISVFKDLKQYDPKRATFSAWSNKVMVNAALQYLRKWKNLNLNQSIDGYEELFAENEDIFPRSSPALFSKNIPSLHLCSTPGFSPRPHALFQSTNSYFGIDLLVQNKGSGFKGADFDLPL